MYNVNSIGDIALPCFTPTYWAVFALLECVLKLCLTLSDIETYRMDISIAFHYIVKI